MDKITIENVTNLFPYKTEDMPKISTPGSRPTYTSLRAFQDKLNDNAMAVPFPRTKLGHLGLVLPTATFKAINNNNEWQDPEEPPEDPEPPKSTGTFPAHESLRKWQNATTRYTTFILTQEALKTQILKSVDVQYINALEHTILPSIPKSLRKPSSPTSGSSTARLPKATSAPIEPA